MPNPLLLLGPTGTTGRHVLHHLDATATPYLLAGRNPAALTALAGPTCVGIRHVDAAAPGAAFADAGCVISTVGPFARLGLPVLDAAIAAGVPYVDTTAEQTFLLQALTRHEAAVAAGVTALPACGVEYLPMFLAAALLGPGPVDTWLWLDDFLPSRGSVRSMVAMAGVGPAPRPFQVASGDRTGWAVRIPGAEEVLVHPASRTHLMLRRGEAMAFRFGWPVARWLDLPRWADRIAERVTDPDAATSARARFTVIVSQGDRALRLDGADVYASTGRFVVEVARALAGGRATQPGVVAAGAALDPAALLQVIGLRAEPCPVRM